jgi:hypothetical protein
VNFLERVIVVDTRFSLHGSLILHTTISAEFDRSSLIILGYEENKDKLK